MQKAVEEYLELAKEAEAYNVEAANEQARQDDEAYKERVLKDIGLTIREYAPDDSPTMNFMYTSVDSDGRHYRNAPIKVSDEEWNAIKEVYEKDQPRQAKEENSLADGRGANGVATLLKLFAIIIYIGGAIIGFLLGRNLYGDFSLAAALVYWIAFFVAGTMMYGFAEIVRLLQVIADK